MQLLPLRDLIKDDLGNYYTIVKQTIDDDINEITVVNAFVEASFRRILRFDDDFKNEFKDYEDQYIGQISMDILLNRIDHLNREDVPGNVYTLEQVLRKYTVKFISMIEYSKNPKVE
ncbi:hypothetical protein [Ammoniphilus sp. 3BR4]|uniref:hypothetical protein n=1 Tax=Ammoniphilus sp. 3BR4 TaxID=3158265 RepID=UPI0034651CA6